MSVKIKAGDGIFLVRGSSEASVPRIKLLTNNNRYKQLVSKTSASRHFSSSHIWIRQIYIVKSFFSTSFTACLNTQTHGGNCSSNSPSEEDRISEGDLLKMRLGSESACSCSGGPSSGSRIHFSTVRLFSLFDS
jgi:hypothetical protein